MASREEHENEDEAVVAQRRLQRFMEDGGNETLPREQYPPAPAPGELRSCQITLFTVLAILAIVLGVVFAGCNVYLKDMLR